MGYEFNDERYDISIGNFDRVYINEEKTNHGMRIDGLSFKKMIKWYLLNESKIGWLKRQIIKLMIK